VKKVELAKIAHLANRVHFTVVKGAVCNEEFPNGKVVRHVNTVDKLRELEGDCATRSDRYRVVVTFR
jgi:hypothetical protein